MIGYLVPYSGGQLFREGLFQFMTSFSLPWYAIMGAYTGVNFGLPVIGCVFLGVVGPTAGRFYIDITSGVPPKEFIRGEWFVATAALTAFVSILCTQAGLGPWAATGISFVVGFTVRLLALYRAWEDRSQRASGRLPTLGRTTDAGPKARRQFPARVA